MYSVFAVDDEETHGLQSKYTERCSPGPRRRSIGRIETPNIPSELACMISAWPLLLTIEVVEAE
jgi:hypothetical protein